MERTFLNFSEFKLAPIKDLLRRHRVLVLIGGVLVIVGILAPFVAGKYIIDGVMDYFLIYLALAESYDILGGFTGYVDLGIIVFFGAGAYAFGILYYVEHSNFLLALFVSALFSGLLGYLVSFPMFRLRGFYFAVATLSLVPLGQYIVLAPALGRWTNGVGGINGIPADYIPAYYSLLAFAMITILVAFFISKSSLGLALTSIRDDEEVAESSGIDTHRLKRVAMVISATLAGLTGCLFAWSQGSLVPTFVFSLYLAFIPVTFALFGGTGTILGPIFGTGVYSLIDYVLRSGPIQSSSLSFLSLYEQAIIGIFLIVVGLFAPDGILGLAKRWRAKSTLLRQQKNENEQDQQKSVPASAV
jgi:branched-chain amino acid transport system permease protein